MSSILKALGCILSSLYVVCQCLRKCRGMGSVVREMVGVLVVMELPAVLSVTAAVYTGCGYVVSQSIFQVFLVVFFTAVNLMSRNVTLSFTFSGSSHQHERTYLPTIPYD